MIKLRSLFMTYFDFMILNDLSNMMFSLDIITNEHEIMKSEESIPLKPYHFRTKYVHAQDRFAR